MNTTIDNTTSTTESAVQAGPLTRGRRLRRLAAAGATALAATGALLVAGGQAPAQAGGDGVVDCIHWSNETELQRPLAAGGVAQRTRITEWLYRWNGRSWIYMNQARTAVYLGYSGYWTTPNGGITSILDFDLTKGSGSYGITERIQNPSAGVDFTYSPFFYNFFEHTYSSTHCQA